MLGSQPGTAIVNCHGSLCVIDGGAVSFGASSIEPAPTRPMIANSAPARKNNFILMKRFLPSPTCKSEKINYRLVEPHDLGALEAKAGHHLRFQKKSASRLKEADRLNQIRELPALVEKEPHTGANQVLPQIATLAGIELGARVIEVVVFDKRAHVRTEKVI